MPQHPNIEELAYATSSGLLAEEVVFALGSLLRGAPLGDDEQRKALATGKAVLQALVSPDPTLPAAAAGMSQLAAAEEALDALQAALVQAPDTDVQQYLGNLIEVLEAAVTHTSPRCSRTFRTRSPNTCDGESCRHSGM